MPGQRNALGRKLDEDDFTFAVQDLSPDKDRPYIVVNSRVLDNPIRHKSVPIGRGQTSSVAMCFHGKLTTHPCATCDWEAPRLRGGGRAA